MGWVDDPAHAIELYDHHNQAVRDGIAAHRLLLYEIGSGWGPLCAILDCPVPVEPYPRSNTREEFHDRHLWRTDRKG